MGCDIHLHSEIKINGNWEHYSIIEVKRDYTLFGIMAGVRNEKVTPITIPKGLPLDLSIITKLDHARMQGDAHSESWFNVKEIEQLEDIVDKDKIHNTFRYLFGNAYGAFHKYRNDYPKEIEDIRFVFWFDN